MEENREATFDLILDERIIERLNYQDLGIYERHFRFWANSDVKAAEAWLIQNWAHEDLRISAFSSTLRSEFAHNLIQHSLHHSGVSAAFEKASAFGSVADYEDNLKAITGTSWNSVDPNYAVEVFHTIRKLSSESLRNRLSKEFLTNWRNGQGPHLLSSLEQMNPHDQVEAALSVLDYQPPKTTIVRLANGDSVHNFDHVTLSKSERALFLQEREKQLRNWAQEAGINHEETNYRLLDHYFRKKDERALHILDLLEPGEDSDLAILKGLKHCCLNTNRGSAAAEIIAFNGALAMTNTEQRFGAARAVFRRIVVKDPTIAKDMVEHSDFPVELTTALREIATQNGL